MRFVGGGGRRKSALTLALAVLLGLGLPGGSGRAGAVPEYSIGQLFAAGKRSTEIRFAKIYEEHARIRSVSYRVQPDQIRYFYFHPTYGAEIKALLRSDPIIRFEEVDRFLTANLGRIRRASFYREGFVTLQLAEPEYVMIIPVSLLTVKRGEEAIKRYLKLEPALFK